MGTTAEKLTYLNTTKGLIKDSINALGGNLTSQSTFRSYAAALDSIYNVLPKTTGTGETLSLTPTLPGKLVLGLKGNTYQTQLSGINMYNPTLTNNGTAIYTQGCTATLDSDGEILKLTATETGNITFGTGRAAGGNYSNDRGWLMEAKPSTKYSFNTIGSTINRIYFNAYDENKVSLGGSSVYGTSGTYTSPANTKYITVAIIISGTTGTTYSVKLVVAEGQDIPTYEKYCGNAPSPNPDYPQPVNVVSGNNTIYVRNKNLKSEGTIYTFYFNATTFTSGNRTLCIPIEANTTYYIKKPILSNRFRVCLSNAVPSTSTSVYEYQDVSSLTETSITNTNYSYLNIFFYQTGETYTEQELYDCLNIYTQETTYPINLPNGMELCKIGTYQDYFYKEDDKWYLHKETGKVVLDGSEDENWVKNGYQDQYYYRTTAFTINKQTSGYSNYYAVIPYSLGILNYNNSIRINDNQIDVVNDKSNTNVDVFKTWLSTHNTILYYVLATPTDIEITDNTLIEQLEAIRLNALSYNGTTNILQINNDMPFIIDASCLKGA